MARSLKGLQWVSLRERKNEEKVENGKTQQKLKRDKQKGNWRYPLYLQSDIKLGWQSEASVFGPKTVIWKSNDPSYKQWQHKSTISYSFAMKLELFNKIAKQKDENVIR